MQMDNGHIEECTQLNISYHRFSKLCQKVETVNAPLDDISKKPKHNIKHG